MTFTAVYESVESGWVQARLAEIPGVITTAATRADAEAMLLDALREYVLSFTDPTASIQLDEAGMTADTVTVTLSSSAA